MHLVPLWQTAMKVIMLALFYGLPVVTVELQASSLVISNKHTIVSNRRFSVTLTQRHFIVQNFFVCKEFYFPADTVALFQEKISVFKRYKFNHITKTAICVCRFLFQLL